MTDAAVAIAHSGGGGRTGSRGSSSGSTSERGQSLFLRCDLSLQLVQSL